MLLKERAPLQANRSNGPPSCRQDTIERCFGRNPPAESFSSTRTCYADSSRTLSTTYTYRRRSLSSTRCTPSNPTHESGSSSSSSTHHTAWVTLLHQLPTVWRIFITSHGRRRSSHSARPNTSPSTLINPSSDVYTNRERMWRKRPVRNGSESANNSSVPLSTGKLQQPSRS